MKKYTKPTVFEKETLHLNENIAIPYCEIQTNYSWQNKAHDSGTPGGHDEFYGYASQQAA